MNLRDLKKSISEMTDEELHDLLHKVRSSRVSSKKTVRESRSRKPAKTAKIPKQLESLLNGLTPDQVMALLAEVESNEG